MKKNGLIQPELTFQTWIWFPINSMLRYEIEKKINLKIEKEVTEITP